MLARKTVCHVPFEISVVSALNETRQIDKSNINFCRLSPEKCSRYILVIILRPVSLEMITRNLSDPRTSELLFAVRFLHTFVGFFFPFFFFFDLSFF